MPEPVTVVVFLKAWRSYSFTVQGEVQHQGVFTSDLSFPFNTYGSPLTVRGTAKVTFAGFAKISERTCAVLDVVFDVSQLEVPPELPGSYRASLSGTSELCFDLDEHTVVHETAELAMSMKADVTPSAAAADMDLETVITVDRRSAPSR